MFGRFIDRMFASKQRAKAKPDMPPQKPRQKPQRMVRCYNVEQVARQVNKKQPMFRMESGGVYVVRLNQIGEPAGFIRLDKDRTLPGRQRKRAARNMRRTVKLKLQKEQSI